MSPESMEFSSESRAFLFSFFLTNTWCRIAARRLRKLKPVPTLRTLWGIDEDTHFLQTGHSHYPYCAQSIMILEDWKDKVSALNLWTNQNLTQTLGHLILYFSLAIDNIQINKNLNMHFLFNKATHVGLECNFSHEAWVQGINEILFVLNVFKLQILLQTSLFGFKLFLWHAAADYLEILNVLQLDTNQWADKQAFSHHIFDVTKEMFPSALTKTTLLTVNWMHCNKLQSLKPEISSCLDLPSSCHTHKILSQNSLWMTQRKW